MLALFPWRSFASAADRVWCIGGDGAGQCANSPCTNSVPLPSLQAALDAVLGAAAEGASDQDVCIQQEEPLEGVAALSDPDGVLQGRLGFLKTHGTGQTALCRPPGSTAPLVDIDAVPADTLLVEWHGAILLANDCDAPPAPFLRVRGAEVGLSQLRVVGGTGPVLDLDDAALNLYDFRINNVQGAAVTGGGDWRIAQGEVASCESDGRALLDQTSGVLNIEQSAFHGNVIRGAPLISTEGQLTMDASYVGANVILGGAPLLRGSAGPSRLGGTSGIWSSVLERNELLLEGEAAPVPLGDLALVQEGGPFCLPLGSDARAFRQRPRPDSTGDNAAEAPLLDLNTPSAADFGAFTVSQSFVLDNDQASGSPLIRLGPGPRTQLAVLHTHIEADNSPRLFATTGADVSVLSARNIFLDPFTPPSGPPASGEATHDVLGEDVLHPLSIPFGGGPWIGPTHRIPDPDAAFVGAGGAAALSSCERLEALCPELAGDCKDVVAGDAPRGCALGGAAERLLTSPVVSELQAPWTWSGSWGELPGEQHPAGPSGWRCELGDTPFDRYEDSFAVAGDLDGYSQMTDCDNEDDAVVPTMPSKAEILTGPCVAKDGVCFVCPEGTEPKTQEPEPTPEPPIPPVPSGNCTASGCAVSWAGLWFAPLGALVSRRRRT